MPDVIRIKPHHFIDIVTAIGNGQTRFERHAYGHAVHTVAAAVKDHPDAVLEMELGIDDICEPCRHHVGDECDDTIDTSYRPEAPSSKMAWNLLIDRRWCERLGLGQGDRLTVTDFCRALRTGMGSDISDIYREIPRERTAERQRALERGVAHFLDAQGTRQPPADAPEGTGQ
ncbi:MAG: hypothetical protein PVH68_12115 [Armatimonadota bacterium]|jgi:hypothetical protein